VGLGEIFDPRAFALGMVALVNPCGFALLPGYLGYFLGTDGDRATDSRLVALNRAQVVALSMSAGFLAVFGVLGLALAGAISSFVDYLPWVTLGLGLGLAALGVAMVLGYQPLLPLPKLEKGTGSRSTASMFLFGLSYALASLTCTISIFLSAVGTAASGATFGRRLGSFVSYGLGMGLLATGLTLAVALGRTGVVGAFRRLLPRIHLVSALVLVVVGLYVAWYGYWSTDPIGIAPGPVTWVEARQNELTRWIDDRTALLGWGFLALNLGLVAAGFLARRAHHPATEPATGPETAGQPAKL
jgi:cytochrome c-type biogenesis protein